MRSEEAYCLARESLGGFTPMVSNFKGAGKSWNMFPGTPLVLVQQLWAPPYSPRGPTSHRLARGLGVAAEASLMATAIPAELGALPPLSTPAHLPLLPIPSPPAPERCHHWVEADFNTLIPSPLLGPCSLSLYTIKGAVAPSIHGTRAPKISQLLGIGSSAQGTVTVPLLLGHLHAEERML